MIESKPSTLGIPHWRNLRSSNASTVFNWKIAKRHFRISSAVRDFFPTIRGGHFELSFADNSPRRLVPP
jgi:hypothetical protein